MKSRINTIPFNTFGIFNMKTDSIKFMFDNYTPHAKEWTIIPDEILNKIGDIPPISPYNIGRYIWDEVIPKLKTLTKFKSKIMTPCGRCISLYDIARNDNTLIKSIASNMDQDTQYRIFGPVLATMAADVRHEVGIEIYDFNESKNPTIFNLPETEIDINLRATIITDPKYVPKIVLGYCPTNNGEISDEFNAIMGCAASNNYYGPIYVDDADFLNSNMTLLKHMVKLKAQCAQFDDKKITWFGAYSIPITKYNIASLTYILLNGGIDLSAWLPIYNSAYEDPNMNAYKSEVSRVFKEDGAAFARAKAKQYGIEYYVDELVRSQAEISAKENETKSWYIEALEQCVNDYKTGKLPKDKLITTANKYKLLDELKIMVPDIIQTEPTKKKPTQKKKNPQ